MSSLSGGFQNWNTPEREAGCVYENQTFNNNWNEIIDRLVTKSKKNK